MGLVRNLKKTLIKFGRENFSRTILSLHKTKGKTNFEETRQLFNNNVLTEALDTETQRTTIATSSTGTSEKTTMVMTTEDIVGHVREWSLDRAADMDVDKEDARAILAEFYEWIEPENDELEIVSLEPED
jgi:hypothetical protein